MSDTHTDETTAPTTTTPDDVDHMYRNTPTKSFAAHLFEASEVTDMGGSDGEQADRPVVSACGRTTAYGPVHRVAFDAVGDVDAYADEADLCDVCTRRLAREVGTTTDETGGDSDDDSTHTGDAVERQYSAVMADSGTTHAATMGSLVCNGRDVTTMSRVAGTETALDILDSLDCPTCRARVKRDLDDETGVDA